MKNFKRRITYFNNTEKGEMVIFSGDKIELKRQESFKFNISDFLTKLKNKYKEHKLFLTVEDIEAKIKGGGFFSKSKWSIFKNDRDFNLEDCLFGFGNDNEGIVFSKNEDEGCWFLFSEKATHPDWVSKGEVTYSSYDLMQEYCHKEIDEIIDELFWELTVFLDKEILGFRKDCLSMHISKFIEWENYTIDNIIKSNRKLTSKKSNIFKELDNDGNGEVDAVEKNDLNLLLKKHQKEILKIDRNYVKKFVKISSYLKDKKSNIQDIFNSIKDTPNDSALNEYVGILKNEINSYRMILANGLTMLVALIKDDVVTYEEIYESMDRINIFDSQWEKDLSQKLSDIGDGINALMYEIETSNRRIISELSNLSYLTESGFSGLNSSITNELQSIGSKIKFNNLLTGIQTYQMYKINKNTNGLIN